MKVVQYKIDDLIEAEYNPRELTKEQHKQISDSIKRFGIVDPVIVNTHKDRKNIIVGGHQRTKVAKELGFKEMPCVEVKLDPDQERELNIRLNKNTGQWDWDNLANYFDLSDLVDWGFNEKDMAFFDLDQLSDDFTLPDGEKEPFQQMTFTLADSQAEFIREQLSKVKKDYDLDKIDTFGNENDNGNSLFLIISQWAEQKI
jgi:hypothetical protein